MDKKRSYKAAVDRAMDWIVNHQQPDGGFGPVESLSHYMTLGAALLYAGRADSAAKLMPYLKKHYTQSDGDFDMPEIRAKKAGSLLECRYAPAWAIFSSHVNLAFDISMPAMPHLLRFQDAKSGGMFGTIEDCERGEGIIHAAVTSVGGQASLATGCVAEAIRMGDHIVNSLIANSPDLSRAFYPVWDTEHGLRMFKQRQCVPITAEGKCPSAAYYAMRDAPIAPPGFARRAVPAAV